MKKQTNVAIFASGGGSNFQSIIDRKDSGDLSINIALMIGNNSKSYCFKRAENHGIPTLHLPPSRYDSSEEYVFVLSQALKEKEIDLIVLAGYMKKLPSEIVSQYRNKIMNIHPGLLPAFGGQGMYGKRVHQAVLDYGAKISGITVHFVDEEYDHGPVILQKTVDVLDEDTADTLAERVLKLEHQYYWQAVKAFAEGSLQVNGRTVTGVVV